MQRRQTMAQRPFIADMGARLGEWLIRQNTDGDLVVGPENVTTHSQRAFRADAGLKMGDWKFYDDSFHLHVTPNGVSSVGTPTEYDLSNVTTVTSTLGLEFNSNNPTGGYVQTGENVAANSTHAFFLEGKAGYSQFVLSAVNLSTGLLDYTITPSSRSIGDNGIVANDSYVLIGTNSGAKLYSTSTQQLLGTIPTDGSSQRPKMSDNYVAMTSPNNSDQIDVRELDPANNFPIVNSFTGASNTGFGSNGSYDLSDTHVVIGSFHYKEDYQGTTHPEDAGKAEVFNIQSGVLERTFYGRDGIHNTSHSRRVRFGFNIAIDGDDVAILSDTSLRDSEAFRIYNYKTGEFITRGDRPIRPNNSSYYLNQLGQEAMEIRGGLVFLYCGALRDDSTYSPNQAVFVYNYSGEMVLRIDDPDISIAGQYYEYTYFGKSLAVSGDKLILGARAYSTSGSGASAQTAIGYHVGKGYIYDLTKTYAEVVIEPVVDSSSQRPFIVDAGLKIGDWTLAQNEDGDIYVSTPLNSSTAISSGTVETVIPMSNFSTNTLEHSITNPMPSSWAQFGRTTAVNDSYVIVGAHSIDELDPTATDSGKAYIYNLSDGSVKYTLDNPSMVGDGSYDNFGTSVGISDSYAIVGAYTEDSTNVNNVGYVGAAYIYDLSDGSLKYSLANPNPHIWDGFGWTSAISDSYAIVGAGDDDTLATNGGSVYVYDVTDGSLLYTINGSHADGRFGTGLAINGSYMLVGEAHISRRKAHIYDLTDGSLVHTFDDPVSSGNTQFGYALAMTDTHAIISAFANNSFMGAAYIYDLSDNSLLYTLENANSANNSHASFGRTVALNDSYAVVGSPAEAVNGVDQVGQAFVFDLSDGSLVDTIDHPDAVGNAQGDNFGYSVSINNTHLVVGAFREQGTDGSDAAGSVYIFSGE